jgi:hypothetical protein
LLFQPSYSERGGSKPNIQFVGKGYVTRTGQLGLPAVSIAAVYPGVRRSERRFEVVATWRGAGTFCTKKVVRFCSDAWIWVRQRGIVIVCTSGVLKVPAEVQWENWFC